jgi:hypothetical protein
METNIYGQSQLTDPLSDACAEDKHSACHPMGNSDDGDCACKCHEEDWD